MDNLWIADHPPGRFLPRGCSTNELIKEVFTATVKTGK